MSVALLLLVVGHWGMQVFTPRGEARPPLALPTPEEAGRAISGRHLFGQADKAAGSGVGSGAVRVLGVATADGSGGAFAIISIDGKPALPAIEGQEFAPGLRLTRVTSTGIEYQRGGIAQHALLQEKRTAAPAAPPVPPATATNPPAPPPPANLPAMPAPPVPAS